MADVLSQGQIDALLNSMQNAEAKPAKEEKPKENYRKYDFYSPKKYTKDRLKMLRKRSMITIVGLHPLRLMDCSGLQVR